VLLPQSYELYPRAFDNPLKFGQEVGVHGVVARLEGFYRLFTAGDQDRQQRCLLFVRSGLDVRNLPRCAAAKTCLSRSTERLRERRDHHVGVLPMLARRRFCYRICYRPERISRHLAAPEPG
jgi:hypothetical protein